MAEISENKKKVKAVHPWAWCRKWGGHREFEEGYTVHETISEHSPIGRGESEAEAWANAAASLPPAPEKAIDRKTAKVIKNGPTGKWWVLSPHVSASRGVWRSVYTEQSRATARFTESSEQVSDTQLRFQKLVAEWRSATAMQSASMKKVMHPAYQRIIGMGPSVLPLILREMRERPGHWFWALDAITQGENPAAECESLSAATEAWIRWGEEKGIL